MSVRTRLGIDIDADASGVDAGVNRAGSKLSSLGPIAKAGGLAVAAGVAVAGKAAFDYLNAGADLASDLAETVSASGAIFGRHADEMEKWAGRAWKAAGLSKGAALDAAVSFGDMFQQIGFTGEQAAQQSKDVVQLAADLGSFKNLETGDVLDRISGALRGEYDSLQAVIPNINAARVQNEALAATGKATAAELTAQEKATAVLAIISKDGARAQGDFARTSDGLANSQKILAARMENTQAAIGQKLLPVKLKLTRFILDDVIPASERLGSYLSTRLGPAFARVGEFIQERAIPAAANVYDWFVEKIAPGIRRTVAPVLDGLQDLWSKVSGEVDENSESLSKIGNALQRVAEFVYTRVFPVLGEFYGTYLSKLGTAFGVVIDVISTLVDLLDSALDKIGAVKDAASTVGDVVGGVGGFIGGAIGRVTGQRVLAGPATLDATDYLVPAPVPAMRSTALTDTATVDARTYLTVQVDGSGVVDEHRIAQQLAEILARWATRLGRPITELLSGPVGVTP